MRALFIALSTLLAVASAADERSGFVSVAEVGAVRLEVDQATTQDRDLLIRVRDYAAADRGSKEVACDIFNVEDWGAERKVGRVVLHAVEPPPLYSGSYPSDDSFGHGSVVKVVYRSPALRLPLSTWNTVHFH